MLAILEKTNPSSFSLPLPIREYFEGVRTGSEGEYEEVTLAQKSRYLAQDCFFLSDVAAPADVFIAKIVLATMSCQTLGS